MKLIHKVEDCTVYKGNDSIYLLKIPSSLELLRAIRDAGTIKHVKRSTNKKHQFWKIFLEIHVRVS